MSDNSNQDVLIEDTDPSTSSVEDITEEEEVGEENELPAEVIQIDPSPSTTPVPTTTTTATAPAAPQEVAFSSKDPYKLSDCQVTFAVSLFPSEREDGSRSAVVGIRSHSDSPILKEIETFNPDALPEIFHELWNELEAQMPYRALEASKHPKKMIGVAKPTYVKPVHINTTHTSQTSTPVSPTPTKTAPQLDLFSML